MRYRISILVLVGFCFISNLKASNLVDTLQQRLADYNQEKPVINLYVHLDRNIYTPDDTIWFKAYVLSPIINEVLYVRITDSKKNQVLEKQFPMYDIRSHGEISIPETLPDGKYYFYAYTDRMISLNPNDVFVQPITVCKNIVSRLEAEASVTNLKKVHRGDKVEIRTRVKGLSGKTLKGKFSLWVGEQLFKKGSLSTNRLGESYVRFTYPKIDNTEMVRCEIQFTQDNDLAELTLNLRHEGNSANVNVYAEGGHFIEGLPNHAVFEILDDNKNPMDVPLDLMDGSKIIGRVHTNKYGLGSIPFIPRQNSDYTLAVHDNDTTTLHEFPGQIESSGYGLRMEAGKKSPVAILTNRNRSDSSTLVLRTMDKILWSQSVSLKNGDSIHIDLPVEDQSKSILNLAVFDTISTPSAERFYLNKSADPYKVIFSTSKAVKKGQTALKVNLSVMDSDNNPVATNLSVSIVEKNTLNKTSFRTILQSYNFKNMFHPGVMVYNELEPDFDDRLITMNWGSKSWSNILRYQPTGYIRLLENTAGFSGVVTPKVEKPKQKARLLLESRASANRKELVSLLKTIQGGNQGLSPYRINKISFTVKDWAEVLQLDTNGLFTVPPKTLMVNPNEEKILSPGVHFSEEFDLKLTDYSVEMDEYVRLGNALNFAQPVNTFTKYEAPVNKTLTKVIQLKEVSVESRSGLFEFEDIGKKEDYVCKEFNVFNCKNHQVGGLKPIPGRVYVLSERGRLFLYHGVGKPFTTAPDGAIAGSIQYVLVKNISRPSTFYNPETTDTTFLKAETRATVYWKPNIYTDETGKTSFNCNTSDRNGEFTIVVQGVEIKTRKPIYGTYDFKL